MMLVMEVRGGGGEAGPGDGLRGDGEPRPAGTDVVAGGSGSRFDRGIGDGPQ